jgi:hypothetical protein
MTATVPHTDPLLTAPSNQPAEAAGRPTTTPPPSKLLLYEHRTRHDAPTESRFARTAISSVALLATPPHIGKIVRHTCKLLPPWPLKGGAVLQPQGTRDNGQRSPTRSLPSPRYWHLPQSIPLGLGGLASSATTLVAPSTSTTVRSNIVPQAHHCWTYGPGRNQDKPSVISC